MTSSDPAPTFAEIEFIGRGLLARTLPVSRWHHREHLLATAYLMRCMPAIDLRRELPDIIRQYNVAMNGKNTEDEGYHHTITLFYINAIEQFFASRPQQELATLCGAMLASPLMSKDFPLTFYTRELLFSREARRDWVDPDLRDITELRATVSPQTTPIGG